MNKTKVVSILTVLVLIITVILNIILLCTDVFHGTYKGSGERYKYEISFNENTFSSKIIVNKDFSNIEGTFTVTYKAGQIVASEYGFYQYLNKKNSNNLEYNTIILDAKSTGNYPSLASNFKRNSVFSFTSSPDSNNAITYTCGLAIFLQVIYSVLIAIAITTLIIVYKKRLRNNKIRNTNNIQKDG